MIRTEASPEKPVLRCVTCGNLKETNFKQKITDKVIVRPDIGLRKEKRRKWKQLIKPSVKHTNEFRGKLVRTKAVHFAYPLIDCVKRNHRIITHIKPFVIKPGISERV